MQEVEIRSARAEEAETLTSLSFASKGYWNYPPAYLERWGQELTITPAYLEEHDVFVCVTEAAIRGYYSLVTLKEEVVLAEVVLKAGTWLDHLFVHPDVIGQKLGTLMFEHMCRRCVARGIRTVHVLADPQARTFYQKVGCRYHQDYPSSIPGRTSPYLTRKMSQRSAEQE